MSLFVPAGTAQKVAKSTRFCSYAIPRFRYSPFKYARKMLRVFPEFFVLSFLQETETTKITHNPRYVSMPSPQTNSKKKVANPFWRACKVSNPPYHVFSCLATGPLVWNTPLPLPPPLKKNREWMGFRKWGVAMVGNLEGPTRKPRHAFLARTPTRKRFPHSTVHECLKAFFRHASVFKTHRHAVYHCLQRGPKTISTS